MLRFLKSWKRKKREDRIGMLVSAIVCVVCFGLFMWSATSDDLGWLAVVSGTCGAVAPLSFTVFAMRCGGSENPTECFPSQEKRGWKYKVGKLLSMLVGVVCLLFFAWGAAADITWLGIPGAVGMLLAVVSFVICGALQDESEGYTY